MKRREFLAQTAVPAAAWVVSGACFDLGPPRMRVGTGGRLSVSPKPPTEPLAASGLQKLGLGPTRDGQLYVPQNHVATEKLPLMVLLHGAGGASGTWFGSYGRRAEDNRVIMLAPDSRGGTWDLIIGGFSEDVAFIDEALRKTFAQCNVDPQKIYLAGFSDGASYALALGIANGDLFSRLVAYSPGFLSMDEIAGKPPIFVSHGVNDTILPIDNSSRRIVPRLRDAGYTTNYVEFNGGHEVPAAISDQAFTWLAS